MTCPEAECLLLLRRPEVVFPLPQDQPAGNRLTKDERRSVARKVALARACPDGVRRARQPSPSAGAILPRRSSQRAVPRQISAQPAPAAHPAITSLGQWTPR